MRDLYSIIVNIGFLIMGIVQILAIYAFFSGYVGWPMILSLIAAIVLAYLPIVGSICGFLGAYFVWGWGILPALLLFFWWPIFVIIGRILGYPLGYFSRFGGSRPV